MAPDLLTYDAAAKLLTVSAATVRRLVRSGRIRGIALTSRCHRVDAASLRAYLVASRIPTAIHLCQSGKTDHRGAGASWSAAVSLAEALERAKKLYRKKPRHAEA